MTKEVKKDDNDDDGEYTVTVDDRDEQIALLHGKIKNLEDNAVELAEKLKAASTVKTSKPQGDHVVLGGKVYEIERTVDARHATEEARKGYIDLDSELIVVKRG